MNNTIPQNKTGISTFIDISSKARVVSLSSLSSSISEPELLCEVTFANGNNLKLSNVISEENFRILLEVLKNA